MFHSENIVFTKKEQFLARNRISFRTKKFFFNFIFDFTTSIYAQQNLVEIFSIFFFVPPKSRKIETFQLKM
jgi:hypothetical protein